MNINWNILYFPNMSIPPREAFSQFVLFFESCGIIVPWEGFDDEQDDATRELVKAGFIRPVAPMSHYGWSPQNDEEFTKVLVGQRPSRGYDKIHLGKLSYTGFFGELEDRRLAVREKNSDWYRVKRPHSLMLMSYIALQLGRQKSVGMVPTTASHDAARCVADLNPSILRSQREKIGAFMRELFVYPTDTDYRDILDFKEKHSKLLVEFRKQLDYVADLEPKIAESELERMVEFKREFIDKMREARWTRFSCSDFATVSLAALAAIYDKSYASAGAALLAPVIKGMYERLDASEHLLRNPAAYAALAQQQLGGRRVPTL